MASLLFAVAVEEHLGQYVLSSSSFPTNHMKVLVTTLTNVAECHWQTTHFTELDSTAWAIVLCSQTHRCSENALIMLMDSLVQQWLVRWTHAQNDDNGT